MKVDLEATCLRAMTFDTSSQRPQSSAVGLALWVLVLGMPALRLGAQEPAATPTDRVVQNQFAPAYQPTGDLSEIDPSWPSLEAAVNPENTGTPAPAPSSNTATVSADESFLLTGYDKGFFIASPEGLKLGNANVPFLLKFNAALQARTIGFADTGDSPRGNEFDFEFERARVIFSGHVYDPGFTYFIQIDGDNADETMLDFKDYYLKYAFSDALAILVGKWKLPFGKQETISVFRQQFVDRSIANEFFNIDRGLGFSLIGSADELFYCQVAMFNGFDVENERANRRGDLDSNPAFAARAYIDPFGPFGDAESDLEFHRQAAMRFGTSVAYSEIDPPGSAELRPPTLRMVDSGVPIADAIAGAADGFNVLLWGADIAYKCNGYSLTAEFFLRNVFNFETAVVDQLRSWGYYVQSGYFLVPERLEIAVRWSRVWGDAYPGQLSRSADEIAGAINYHIRGQNLKLSFDVTHLNGAPLFSDDSDFHPGDHGFLFRGQFQWMF